MAYFDDPKNKQGWAEAMVMLRKERERRAAGGEPTDVSAMRGFTQSDPEREPVSFEQLVEEERLERAGGKSRGKEREAEPELSFETAVEKAIEREDEMTMQGPEMGRSL
jgi:hypothetical protein